MLAAAIAYSGGTDAAAGNSFEGGNGLYGVCSTPQLGEQGYCLGYVVGTLDTLFDAQEKGTMPQLVCVPGNVSGNQVRDVVVNYLAGHPEQRHFAASSLVLRALSMAFPCK